MLSHGQTVHFRPHSVIHHQKAEHHSIPKFRLKVNFRHPMKRQNFGDTSGQDPNLHLALCHNLFLTKLITNKRRPFGNSVKDLGKSMFKERDSIAIDCIRMQILSFHFFTSYQKLHSRVMFPVFPFIVDITQILISFRKHSRRCTKAMDHYYECWQASSNSPESATGQPRLAILGPSIDSLHITPSLQQASGNTVEL